MPRRRELLKALVLSPLALLVRPITGETRVVPEYLTDAREWYIDVPRSYYKTYHFRTSVNFNNWRGYWGTKDA
jgi:hypothetical protein